MRFCTVITKEPKRDDLNTHLASEVLIKSIKNAKNPDVLCWLCCKGCNDRGIQVS